MGPRQVGGPLPPSAPCRIGLDGAGVQGTCRPAPRSVGLKPDATPPPTAPPQPRAATWVFRPKARGSSRAPSLRKLVTPGAAASAPWTAARPHTSLSSGPPTLPASSVAQARNACAHLSSLPPEPRVLHLLPGSAHVLRSCTPSAFSRLPPSLRFLTLNHRQNSGERAGCMDAGS